VLFIEMLVELVLGNAGRKDAEEPLNRRGKPLGGTGIQLGKVVRDQLGDAGLMSLAIEACTLDDVDVHAKGQLLSGGHGTSLYV